MLLWSGHRRCAMDAMELFTFRRSAQVVCCSSLLQSVVVWCSLLPCGADVRWIRRSFPLSVAACIDKFSKGPWAQGASSLLSSLLRICHREPAPWAQGPRSDMVGYGDWAQGGPKGPQEANLAQGAPSRHLPPYRAPIYSISNDYTQVGYGDTGRVIGGYRA